MGYTCPKTASSRTVTSGLLLLLLPGEHAPVGQDGDACIIVNAKTWRQFAMPNLDHEFMHHWSICPIEDSCCVCVECDDLSRIGGESTNTLTRRPDAIYHLRVRAPPPSPSQSTAFNPATARPRPQSMHCSCSRPRVPRLHASVRPAPAAPAPAPPTPHARAGGRTEQASNRSPTRRCGWGWWAQEESPHPNRWTPQSIAVWLVTRSGCLPGLQEQADKRHGQAKPVHGPGQEPKQGQAKPPFFSFSSCSAWLLGPIPGNRPCREMGEQLEGRCGFARFLRRSHF